MNCLPSRLGMVVGILATLAALVVWGVGSFAAVDVRQVAKVEDSTLNLNRAMWRAGDDPASFYGSPLGSKLERIAFYNKEALHDPQTDAAAPAELKAAAKDVRYLVVDQNNPEDGRLTLTLFRFFAGIAIGGAYLAAGGLLVLASFGRKTACKIPDSAA